MESREALIGVLTTAGSAFIRWIVGRRKENADISTIQLENSQKVIDMFTAMNEKLEAKVDQLSKKVDELTVEIENLREENHNLKIGKTPKVIKTKPIE
jgi:peptidoglycan hydrolase CwlO-like protein